jgi:indole-3-glycerol phosphate synthase
MILDEIVLKKRLDLAREEKSIPLLSLEKQAEQAPQVRDFFEALAKPQLSIIAEVKRASPSKGIIAENFDPLDIAKQYENSGASAISVLTEKHYFKGDNQYLTEIRGNVKLPVLRKDFIICERQVIETRAIGADAILLIAAILDDTQMKNLYKIATEYGLHCLFEAHNSEEIKRIIDCGAKIIGINNRNLKTFHTDIGIFEELRVLIPRDCLVVAESGIHTYEDARRMANAGADAILIGESLMKSKDIANSLKEFIGEVV